MAKEIILLFFICLAASVRFEKDKGNSKQEFLDEPSKPPKTLEEKMINEKSKYGVRIAGLPQYVTPKPAYAPNYKKLDIKEPCNTSNSSNQTVSQKAEVRQPEVKKSPPPKKEVKRQPQVDRRPPENVIKPKDPPKEKIPEKQPEAPIIPEKKHVEYMHSFTDFSLNRCRDDDVNSKHCYDNKSISLFFLAFVLCLGVFVAGPLANKASSFAQKPKLLGFASVVLVATIVTVAIVGNQEGRQTGNPFSDSLRTYSNKPNQIKANVEALNYFAPFKPEKSFFSSDIFFTEMGEMQSKDAINTIVLSKLEKSSKGPEIYSDNVKSSTFFINEEKYRKWAIGVFILIIAIFVAIELHFC